MVATITSIIQEDVVVLLQIISPFHPTDRQGSFLAACRQLQRGLGRGSSLGGRHAAYLFPPISDYGTTVSRDSYSPHSIS